MKCPSCGETVGSKSAFCPYCGKRIPPRTEYNTCSACGAKVEKSAKFCPNCAAPMLGGPQKRICRNCGAELSADAKFCSRCSMPAGPLPWGEPIPPVGNLSWWPQSNRIGDLCSSVAFLTLMAALTVQLVCRILFGFQFSQLITNIPAILICIGGWICFAGGRKNMVPLTGFKLIAGTLFFLAIANCVGFGAGFLLGVVMALTEEYARVLGFIVMVICGVAFLLVWIFWNQLRLTANSARQVVLTGRGGIVAGMYSVILLYIQAAANLITMVNVSSSSYMSSAISNWIYYNVPYIYQDVAYQLTNQLIPYSSSLTDHLGNLAAVVVPLVAGLLLQHLYKTQKEWVR